MLNSGMNSAPVNTMTERQDIQLVEKDSIINLYIVIEPSALFKSPLTFPGYALFISTFHVPDLVLGYEYQAARCDTDALLLATDTFPETQYESKAYSSVLHLDRIFLYESQKKYTQNIISTLLNKALHVKCNPPSGKIVNTIRSIEAAPSLRRRRPTIYHDIRSRNKRRLV